MRVKIRLMGIVREAGKKEITLDTPEDSTVRAVLQHLISKNESLRLKIWDREVDSPSPNTLIMLDGVEINNLNGIETSIKPKQEIVLLSVVHGG
jgi:molybdopterin converting factor small subunit